MTTTKTNSNATVNTVANEQVAAKVRAPKYLLNDDAKNEMYSLKQALNMVKIAYDCGENKEQTRKYILSLGYSAKTFKALTWEQLKEFAITKSGRFSPCAAINAIVKFADANDLSGEKAAKAAKRAEREAAKAAGERIKAKKAEKTAAKAENKKAEKAA